MKESASEVAVVGGGPCGLLAALLLARHGVNVALFERHPDASTHPKAMGVSRRTGEIYRQLGLLEAMQVQDTSRSADCLSIWSEALTGGEEWGRVPMPPRVPHLTPCEPFHCPQPLAEDVLRRALSLEPRASLHFGCKVTACEETGGGARLTVQPQSGEAHPHFCSWVVAADGAASPMRSRLGIGTTGPGDMGHFLNVYFRADYGRFMAGRRAVLYQALTGEGMEFFVAVNGDNLWLMHHFLQPGEAPEDFSDKRLVEIIRHFGGHPELPVELLGVSPWVMSPKLADQFRAGRVFLTGDASARLSPAGGLGLNTGLQSVHNLAWKLAAVVRGHAAESLLDTYESERRPHAALTMDSTNNNADEILCIVEAALEGRWADVRTLIAGSLRRGAGLGLDIGFTYLAGAFVPDGVEVPATTDPRNDYEPSANPGRRAPHLSISIGGRPASTLDFFGREWVLLAGRGGGGWRGDAPAGVRVCVVGEDFGAEPGAFEDLYGLAADGAVLVRPDGVVATRWAARPASARGILAETLDGLLRGAVPGTA